MNNTGDWIGFALRLEKDNWWLRLAVFAMAGAISALIGACLAMYRIIKKLEARP